MIFTTVGLVKAFQDKGYSVTCDENRKITIPYHVGNNIGLENRKSQLCYEVKVISARLLLFLVIDISQLCNSRKSIEDLADVVTRFIMNHNPQRLDLKMIHGTLIIGHNRSTGIFQTATVTVEVFEEFCNISIQCWQWILFRLNKQHYEAIWGNVPPPDNFHML